MAYDDNFDRIRNDRDGNPIGDEETTRQYEMASDDKTDDLENEELEDAVEEEEEDEAESRSLTITIKGKFFSSYKLSEIKDLLEGDIEEAVDGSLDIEVDETA